MQVSTLNLSSNRLTNTNAFAPLSFTADCTTPISIDCFDLTANPLQGLTSLCGLRDVPNLEELIVSETPLSSLLEDDNRGTVTKLRKYVPGLKRIVSDEFQTIISITYSMIDDRINILIIMNIVNRTFWSRLHLEDFSYWSNVHCTRSLDVHILTSQVTLRGSDTRKARWNWAVFAHICTDI